MRVQLREDYQVPAVDQARQAIRGGARRILINPSETPDLEPRKALAKLPPLLKGYIRVGAKIGAEAVSDRQFGTTDVFIIMPVAEIDPRYITYFSTPESEARLAA